MALKAMVFIDGAWLYRSRTTVFAKLGEENFEVDYARLPRLLCEELANAIDEDVSLVRTLYYGTIPSARASFNTGKQRAFYEFLENSCHYETNIHEVDVGYGENLADEAWISMAPATRTWTRRLGFFWASASTVSASRPQTSAPMYTAPLSLGAAAAPKHCPSLSA